MARETLQETLAHIRTKIDELLDTGHVPTRRPVDCVAFNGTEVPGIGYVDPTCWHPDRGGPAFCLSIGGGGIRRRGSKKNTRCSVPVQNQSGPEGGSGLMEQNRTKRNRRITYIVNAQV